jgi:hypothetical protein
MEVNNQWQTSSPQIFWGEIAPTDHVVQIYENDQVFLNLLEGFVTTGFKANECVVVIATNVHLVSLKDQLIKLGYDVEALCADHLYIPLDAEEVLAKFMANDWPDAKLFHETILQIIKPAHSKKRKVRAFGEMVAILWAKGLSGATVHLENLWNRFCEVEAFCLFCAYPRAGFTQDINASIDSICCTHSKMISGEHKSRTEIFYKAAHKKVS